MIPFTQQLIAVIFSLVLVLVTVQLIRTHRLREEYALVWLAASLGIFLLSIFGGLVGRLAAFFSVTYSPTLVLVAGLLFALVVLLSQSVVISSQANQLRDLAQSVTLLEWRLRQLEGQNGEQSGEGDAETENDLEQTANNGAQKGDGSLPRVKAGKRVSAQKRYSIPKPGPEEELIEIAGQTGSKYGS